SSALSRRSRRVARLLSTHSRRLRPLRQISELPAHQRQRTINNALHTSLRLHSLIPGTLSPRLKPRRTLSRQLSLSSSSLRSIHHSIRRLIFLRVLNHIRQADGAIRRQVESPAFENPGCHKLNRRPSR